MMRWFHARAVGRRKRLTDKYDLLIAYDFDKPGQNYEAVHDCIKSLGRRYHAQQSLFYVHTAFAPEEAHRAVFSVMDRIDKL
jgi:hypothetical protein